MADKINVEPTPIQRNAFDVAMELTSLYWRNKQEADIEKLDSIFARFYSMARLLEYSNGDTLRKHLSNELNL
ncbi:hypothetical protein GCM10023310_00700 [Paenibacillus vulneris]|uniref:Uncharacterized protein n=1 Tax=Paenibacillus vulneris TaxID=1133364 RepID=A0ABW3UZ55_9BACL